jgi:hypothetical protein
MKDHTILDNEVFDETIDATSTPTEYILVARKVFDRKMILIGTAIGGPLSAAYFLSHNFKELVDMKKVLATWAIALSICLAGYIAIIKYYEYAIVLGIVFTAFSVVLAEDVYKRFQKKEIEGYLDEGGETYQWWVVIGIAFLFLALTYIKLIPTLTYLSTKHRLAPNSLEGLLNQFTRPF